MPRGIAHCEKVKQQEERENNMKKNMLMFMSIINALIIVSLTAGADLIFHEDFDSLGENSTLTLVEWHANYGASATGVNESNTDFNNGPIVSGSNGSDGKTTGFYFYDFDGFGGQPVLHWTEKQASFGTIDNLTTVSFFLNNQSTSADFKVALKVESDWFVSQDVFNATGGWAEQSLDVQTASWNSLTFISGSSLSEGGAASLPLSGTVTAVGIFDASGTSGYSGRSRIDSYVVNGVIPEPATLGLFGLSAVGLMLLRRQCRR